MTDDHVIEPHSGPPRLRDDTSITAARPRRSSPLRPRVEELEDRLKRIAARRAALADLAARQRDQIEELKARNRAIQASHAALRGRLLVRIGAKLARMLAWRPFGLARRPAAAPAPDPAASGQDAPTSDPARFRDVVLDRLSGASPRSSAPLKAVILPGNPSGDVRRQGATDGKTARASSEGLGDALQALGWSVRDGTEAGVPAGHRPAPDDVALFMDPTVRPADAGQAIRVALVGGDVDRWLAQPWFDDLDVVLAGDEAIGAAIERDSTRVSRVAPGMASTSAGTGSAAALAAQVAGAVAEWAAARRYALILGADSWQRALTWGDTFFARALQRQLERRGVPTLLAVLSEAGGPRVARSDVVVDLFGSGSRPTRPAQLNVLWIISHPDRVSTEMCERYDLLFAASTWFADDLSVRLGRPVIPLLQATDPERFHPGAPGPRHELLFVGNSRGVRRQILDDLRGTQHDLAVYGRNWSPSLLDPRHLRGEWVANDKLVGYYAQAAIVLADHWPDMRDEGFIANRIFDAAAAGAFVISDDLPELEAELDGGVVAYRDATELNALVDRFLADPDARREHAARARSAVLARHTFGHRADVIVHEVSAAIEDRRRHTPPMPVVR